MFCKTASNLRLPIKPLECKSNLGYTGGKICEMLLKGMKSWSICWFWESDSISIPLQFWRTLPVGLTIRDISEWSPCCPLLAGVKQPSQPAPDFPLLGHPIEDVRQQRRVVPAVGEQLCGSRSSSLEPSQVVVVGPGEHMQQLQLATKSSTV